MAWGGISTDLYRLSKLAYHVSFCRYQDEVLGTFVRPNAASVSPGFLWVNDKAWPYVPKALGNFLEDERTDTTDSPSPQMT